MNTPFHQKVNTTRDRLEALLLSRRNARGFWEGRLSSSALATGVAAVALHRADPVRYGEYTKKGMRWLSEHANSDGGWGDTPESPSNLTATVLCWAALRLCGDKGGRNRVTVENAEAWLQRNAGGADAGALRAAVLARYGADRTFAGPILTMLTLAGCMGAGPVAWGQVPQLPFELAVLPSTLFRWLKLSVVSYALPALIVIGLVRHRQCPSACLPLRWLRNRVTPRALTIARQMQPANGGYEEATPLTAFVTMSLLAAGEGDSPIVVDALDFLCRSMREDGDWPIDTNLSTWVTTLSIQALGAGPRGGETLTAEERGSLQAWLLAQQLSVKHPLTSAKSGGWGWSDLAGSMPDADDTAGVLLALRRLGGDGREVRPAVERGVRWLLDLQNADGGIPTFTKGWGKLPFDRSCPDITAHALRAFGEWRSELPPALQQRMDRASRRGVRYLEQIQHSDGSWTPLWFGNQHADNEENRTYGTAQTVIALSSLHDADTGRIRVLVARGVCWLVRAQNADGGWGGQAGVLSSIEETALAVRALCRSGPGNGNADAARRGAAWLIERTREGDICPPAPIGLYFARLWYSEAQYPVVFALHALSDYLKCV